MVSAGIVDLSSLQVLLQVREGAGGKWVSHHGVGCEASLPGAAVILRMQSRWGQPHPIPWATQLGTGRC